MLLIKALLRPRRYMWGKFYYSEKQEEHHYKHSYLFPYGKYTTNTCVVLSGEKKYTEMTNVFAPKLKEKWDDVVFLGYGVIKSVNGTDQFQFIK